MAVDIHAIEVAYKAGKLTNVDIAHAHNVSEGVIRKYARQYGWKRGDAVISHAAKLPPIPPDTVRHTPTTPPDTTSEALTGDLVRRMLDELDATTSHLDELEELIEAETAGDKDGRRRAGMLKAISLPTRAATLKTLLTAQAELERADAGGKKGKKEQAVEKARETSSGGKFRASAPPLRVVGRT